MTQVLLEVNYRMQDLARCNKAQGKPVPLILMYGHSMAGAAIAFLTGEGKVGPCAVLVCCACPVASCPLHGDHGG